MSGQSRKGNGSATEFSVLVVDDDRISCAVAARLLEDLGIGPVEIVTSGHEALERIGQRAFALVLCDLNMPGMDGIEFLRHLATIGYEGALALVSGEDARVLSTARVLGDAHGLRMVGFLSKPLRRAELAGLVSQADPIPVAAASSREASVSAHDLEAAIASAHIEPSYQPKIRLSDRMPCGVEVLATWRHPVVGPVSPALFVPMAESNGLIDALTDRVLTTALSEANGWRKRGIHLALAVNLSTDTLSRLDFPEHVSDLAARAGVAPADLTFEVTESRVMNEARKALDVLVRLCLKGFSLSIDDFGTGYSSLARLRSVPFTELKVDRSFVAGAATDPAARAILESSVDLARKLGMGLVAEGVELDEELALVESLGCHVVQGFLFAPPMGSAQLLEWIAARRAA